MFIALDCGMIYFSTWFLHSTCSIAATLITFLYPSFIAIFWQDLISLSLEIKYQRHSLNRSYIVMAKKIENPPNQHLYFQLAKFNFQSTTGIWPVRKITITWQLLGDRYGLKLPRLLEAANLVKSYNQRYRIKEWPHSPAVINHGVPTWLLQEWVILVKGIPPFLSLIVMCVILYSLFHVRWSMAYVVNDLQDPMYADRQR